MIYNRPLLVLKDMAWNFGESPHSQTEIFVQALKFSLELYTQTTNQLLFQHLLNLLFPDDLRRVAVQKITELHWDSHSSVLAPADPDLSGPL